MSTRARATSMRAIRHGQQRTQLARILQWLYGAGEQGIAVPDLTPGNGFLFQDSAGTTPVTAYEQPVGLILDRSKGLVLGSELRGTGTTTKIGTVTDATYNTATGAGTAVRVDALNQSGVTFTVTENAVYKITFTATSGDVRIRNGNFGGAQLALALSGQTFTGYIYPTSASIFFAATSDGATANFTVTVLQLLPGNHIIQATSTKRPTLSARYNLLTYTEDFSNAAWLKERVTVSGNTIAVNGAGSFAGLERQLIPFVVGSSYTLRVSLLAGTKTLAQIWFGGGANVSTATRIVSGPGSISAAGVNSTNVSNLSATVATVLEIVWTEQIGSHGVKFYPGDWGSQALGDSVVLVFPDVRRTIDTIGQPAYQRVGAATDYDTAGFYPYLAFDGTDDSMATAASADFTGTDKVTLFAGVTKLSDAARGMVVELTNNAANSFQLNAPSASLGDFSFLSRGSVLPPAVQASPFSAPFNAVVACAADIAAPSQQIRLNGTLRAQNSDTQGTGNYSNSTLFVGARNNNALFFNGRLYPFFIRGAATDAGLIAQVEQFLKARMPVNF